MVDIDRLQGEVLRLSGLLGLDRQRARLNRWSSLGNRNTPPCHHRAMTTFDDPIDDHIRKLRDIISRHRYAVIPVGYGGCSVPGCCGQPAGEPWTYTVGLAQAGVPELVVMGSEPATAHALISHVAKAALAGRPLPVDSPFKVRGRKARLAHVPVDWVLADFDRIAMWLNIYGGDTDSIALSELQQVVWTDAHGRFPDEPGCEPAIARGQPLLNLDPVAHTAPQPRGKPGRHRRRAA